MNNIDMGRFIAELRKEKQMTQKALAQRLHITDKAVSKWERGLSCPDIALLPELAETLGVTLTELLQGRRSEAEPEQVKAIVDHALDYAQEAAQGRVSRMQRFAAAAFTALLCLGAGVCAICDWAVSGAWTWSLYPISAIVFTWLILIPLVCRGWKGIRASLAALSVSIVPFLFVLSRIMGGGLLLPLGARIAAVCIAFLWCAYLLFAKYAQRKWLAGAITMLLCIPMCLIINGIVAGMVSVRAWIDHWDVLAFGVILIAAAAMIAADRQNKREK